MSSDFIKRIPSEPGRWRAIILALVMHLILLLILWFSVYWQNQKPVAVEAEIWNPQSTLVAPTPPPPITPPEPAPEPVKTPETIKKIEPTKPDKTAPTENVKKTADIALEKEKKRKEQQDLKDKAEAEPKFLVDKNGAQPDPEFEEISKIITKAVNNLDNLNWVTCKENNIHNHNMGFVKYYTKKIIQYDLEMNEVNKYNSIKEASIALNISNTNILGALKKRQKTAGGFIFKYLD